MHRCTLEDLERVHGIVRHPDVYPELCDDGCPPAELADFGPLLANGASYFLMPGEGILFMGLMVNHATWEVHTAVVPERRGKWAVEGARDAANWMFEHTPCRKLITRVPSFNRKALAFALMVGMKREGVDRKSFLKSGTLYDQEFLGIVKEEWICRQLQPLA